MCFVVCKEVSGELFVTFAKRIPGPFKHLNSSPCFIHTKSPFVLVSSSLDIQELEEFFGDLLKTFQDTLFKRISRFSLVFRYT